MLITLVWLLGRETTNILFLSFAIGCTVQSRAIFYDSAICYCENSFILFLVAFPPHYFVTHTYKVPILLLWLLVCHCTSLKFQIYCAQLTLEYSNFFASFSFFFYQKHHFCNISLAQICIIPFLLFLCWCTSVHKIMSDAIFLSHGANCSSVWGISVQNTLFVTAKQRTVFYFLQWLSNFFASTLYSTLRFYLGIKILPTTNFSLFYKCLKAHWYIKFM